MRAHDKIPRGYVSLDHLKRRLQYDKEVQEIYKKTRFEHEVVVALISKRIKAKLSQAQVAKKAHMHQSAIARLESGDNNPRLDTLARVATALNVQHVKLT